MNLFKKVILILALINIELLASYITVCQNCHGKNFERRALGRSKIVKNMKKKKIEKRLIYFKTSNSVMKSYASGLSEKQIKQIANVFGR